MDYQQIIFQRNDPDELMTIIDGSLIKHRILPGGQLVAQVERISLDYGMLYRGRYQMAVQAEGAFPSGLVTIGMILDTPSTVSINGLFCPASTIQLYGEGAEISYIAPPGSTWLAYCVDREQIQNAALTLYGRALPIPNDIAVSFNTRDNGGQSIAATIQALFNLGRYASRSAHRMTRSLEEQLLYDLASSLDEAQHDYRAPVEKHISQRRLLMQRAEDYLRANLSEPFSLKAFAQAVGTSARMLEYHFKQIYGVTPTTWFRSMKLNEVNRELIQLQGSNAQISEIATRWGFLHLSRFSAEYRQLFGESPKKTLYR